MKEFHIKQIISFTTLSGW